MAEHVRVRMQRVDNPNPSTQSILEPSKRPAGEPCMQGDGDTDLLCAGRERVIALGVSAGQITGTVIACPDCGIYNRTRT